MQIKRIFIAVLVIVLVQSSMAFLLQAPVRTVAAQTTWDRSELEITGKCHEPGTTHFTVTNTGAAMTGSTTWRVYVNDALVDGSIIQLGGNATWQLSFTYPGQEVRMEVDQRPGYPGDPTVSDALTCGEADTSTATPTSTATATATATATNTATATATATNTATSTPTATATSTPTATATFTLTPTATATNTATPTATPTGTLEPEFYCLISNVDGNLEYVNDFETLSPGDTGWSDNYQLTTAPRGQRFLGEYGNETVTLAVGCLGEHEYVRVSFDVYAIRSWDGNETFDNGLNIGPDHWQLAVEGGEEVIHTTFANWYLFTQSYPGEFGSADFPAYANVFATDALGFVYSGSPKDSVYRMSFIIPHSEQFLTLNFSAWGLQPMDDESWGLDNFHVVPFESLTTYYLPVVIH